MTTYLTDAIALVRQDLRDPSAVRFSTADLSRALDRAVLAYSRSHPYWQKSTIATTNDSLYIDISTLTNRITVDKVEYPIGETPPVFQPFTLYLDSICMLTTKGDGANCYIFWSGVHILTESSYTVPVTQRDIITLGAAAYALQAYVDTLLAEKAAAALESARTAADKVSSKVTLAETALTSAANVATDIATQLTSAGAQLTAAIAALSAAISTAAGSIDAAIASKLTDVSNRIDSANTSLTAASTALNSSNTRITIAANDLASGAGYIPTANIGLDPAGKWADYSGRDIEAANSLNQQAAAFIQQAAQHIASAHGELAHIKALDDKRSACIATGQQYIAAADSYIRTANELNHKRTACLQTATTHLASANSFTNESAKHRSLSSAYTTEAKTLGAVAADRLKQFMNALLPGNITRKFKTLNMISEE